LDADDNGSNYVIRISKLTSVNKLYWNRAYYAKLSRNWTQGSKLIFLTKTASSYDGFIGIGKIEMIYELSELEHSERKICIENNFYSKIVFGKMVKFIPAVPIKNFQPVGFGKMSAPLLDGADISESEITKIEQLANILTIT
jgi:hypothetical protein